LIFVITGGKIKRQQMRELFNKLDKIADIDANGWVAVTLERAIFIFMLLMAAAMPHSIAATQIAWLVGMLLWFIRMAVKPRPPLPRTPLDFVLWLFFGLTVISSALSYAPYISLDKLRGAALFLIVYFIVANVRTGRAARLLVAVLVGSCLVNVIWTPVERMLGRGVEIHGIAAESPLAKALLYEGDTLLKANGKKIATPDELVAEIEKNDTTTVDFYRPDFYFYVPVNRAELLPGNTALEKLGVAEWRKSRNWRSAGFYGHYTTYSEVLQLILSLALGLWLAVPDKRSRNSFILIAVVALMSLALLMTVTRASQGAFAVSALLMVSLSANRKTVLAFLAILLPVAAIGVYILQQSRGVGFFDQNDSSTTWRETVYGEGVKLLMDNPRHMLAGIGMDTITLRQFKEKWHLFDDGKLPAGHFHSTYLQIAVERGIPALAAWLLFIWVYLKMLRRLLKSNQLSHWRDRGAVLGILGGAIGFFISGMVHYNYGDQEVVMVFYFLMGIAACYYRDKVVTPLGAPVEEPVEELPQLLADTAPA
jgi:O-antigen ligase